MQRTPLQKCVHSSKRGDSEPTRQQQPEGFIFISCGPIFILQVRATRLLGLGLGGFARLSLYLDISFFA